MFSALLRSTILPLSVIVLAACGARDSIPDQAKPISAVPDSAATLALACTGCHSDQSGAIASLNGYSEVLLLEILSTYKSDLDGTTVMHRLARGYSSEDIAVISAYLGEGKGSE